jgi:hypothetical protein
MRFPVKAFRTGRTAGAPLHIAANVFNRGVGGDQLTIPNSLLNICNERIASVPQIQGVSVGFNQALFNNRRRVPLKNRAAGEASVYAFRTTILGGRNNGRFGIRGGFSRGDRPEPGGGWRCHPS